MLGTFLKKITDLSSLAAYSIKPVQRMHSTKDFLEHMHVGLV